MSPDDVPAVFSGSGALGERSGCLQPMIPKNGADLECLERQYVPSHAKSIIHVHVSIGFYWFL